MFNKEGQIPAALLSSTQNYFPHLTTYHSLELYTSPSWHSTPLGPKLAWDLLGLFLLLWMLVFCQNLSTDVFRLSHYRVYFPNCIWSSYFPSRYLPSRHITISQWFSKCGPRTSSFCNSGWNYTNFGAPSQTYWVRCSGGGEQWYIF